MKSIFVTLVEQKKLKIPSKLHQQLIATAEGLPKMDPVGVRWSQKNYRKGYTSYGSLSNLHSQFTVFDRLKTELDREVKAYAKALKLQFPRGELKLSSLWVNVMPKDCYHAFHAHPNSIVSGTYYLKVPKGSAILRLEDPRSGLFMASPARKIQMDLTPKSGEVIFFESWLKHEVPPHDSSDSRISVSFNYDWI